MLERDDILKGMSNKNDYQHYVTPDVSLTDLLSLGTSCVVSLNIRSVQKYFLWSVFKKKEATWC